MTYLCSTAVSRSLTGHFIQKIYIEIMTDQKNKKDSLFLTYYTFLRAVANSTNKDIESILIRDVRMEFSVMNRQMHKFYLKIRGYLNEETLERYDELSFSMLELTAMLRDPKNADKAINCLDMIREYLAGTCKIVDDEKGIHSALPYAYELDGKLFYPDQLIGRDLSTAKPLYI